ncbi:peptide transporter family 1 [Drosophila novamexicana]|uniref:peptide transporter family 1 n=1 Tax=Drosophila novamexicana TaxID=47314 RepID=UPI0011E58CE0|nr:peptide transporter family 1 [Drosophila novamexicana]XP_030568855.1 peptide transporter family 1 [Drosophila novamexicana]XP_030568856.1 peptide transporter family 1 [Drosophila novamexicana]XP_030568857.1 peptide transporter family 1 [Drosophila novamexicana]
MFRKLRERMATPSLSESSACSCGSDSSLLLRSAGGVDQLPLESAGVYTARTRYYESEFDTNESEIQTDTTDSRDWPREACEESPEYPKSVAFIISNEFCERFNYYGMRAILVLYLTHKLGYDEETATVLFHVFTMLVYIFPLVGALIADGWLGKYSTILYLSVVYSLGAMIVAFGAIPIAGMPVKLVTIVGLLLIAVGTGGIKPCVSAFGGDQFQLPAQAVDLAKFFSLFYFAINAGSMISTTVTPILRADVYCFGEEDCYSLAFGVPAILMIVSMLIFVAGKRRYKLHPPSGNMIFGVSQCITNAYKGWRHNRRDKPMMHFLDYATPVVGQQMVYETKCLTKILLLYVPFPIFWALSDQQGSRWTFQATHMDGSILGYQIKPDQMQVVNPLLILAFIPLFDYLIYPLLARVGIKRPLQKLSIGLLLAAFGFFLSAAVELRLEQLEPAATPSAPDMAHLRLYNGMPCRYDFTSDLVKDSDSDSIESLGMWSNLGLHVPQPKEYTFLARPQTKQCPSIEGSIRLEPGKSVSYFLANAKLQEFPDGLSSAQRINRPPLLRTLVNTPAGEGPVLLRAPVSGVPGIRLDIGNLTALHEISLGYGELDINGKRAASFEAKNGGLYSLLVQGNARDGYQYNMLEVVPPTSLSILWQLPQIVVMTAAEIMFSVTGLEFSFTQAPVSMKSVLQACWLLSVAIGNMIVVVIAEVKFVSTQSAEFALFASIMLVNLLIFLFLARNYKYMEMPKVVKDEEINELTLHNIVGHQQVPNVKRGAAGGGGGGDVIGTPGHGSYRNQAYDTYLEP